MMRLKIGLSTEDAKDQDLIRELMSIMNEEESDFTNTFKYLYDPSFSNDSIFKNKKFIAWNKKWQNRLNQESQPLDKVKVIMDKNNPSIIPRNHIVENAITNAVKGDLSPFKELVEILKDPYLDSSSIPDYYKKPPKESEKVLQTFCGT